MTKKINIGIISKELHFDKDFYLSYSKNNLKYLYNKCNIIGILIYNDYINYDVLDVCDAFIFQGGNDIEPYYYEILKYAINSHKPVLGICLGHQIIGSYNNKDNLKEINNHYDTNHNINIKENSYLYKLFGNKMIVNSRHKYAIKDVNYPFKITSISNDNIIESIEYIDDNNFILGVQFHPEDMSNTEILYNSFINEIKKRKQDL